MGKILIPQNCSMGKPSYHELKTGGGSSKYFQLYYGTEQCQTRTLSVSYKMREKMGLWNITKGFTSTVCSLLSTMVR
jgi:hypothetical protein